MGAPPGVVVLTGATGFVGTLVLERLLGEPGPEVVALVRAAGHDGARERLRDLALRTWGDAGVLDGRVEALAADVRLPGLGLAPGELEALAERTGTVVHCAASVDFELPLDEARAINAEGTARLAGLARRARDLGSAGRLVHVSTAYVHGAADDRGPEDGPHGEPAYRNTYERTKHEAEKVALGLDGTAIVRPSVVVGDAVTGWTSAYNVIYPTLRLLARRVLRALPARPDSIVDLVAVDQVAAVVTACVDRPEVTGPVQVVAGEGAPTMAELRDLLASHLGLAELPFDPAAAERLGAYAPYTRALGRFELRRALDLGFDPVPAAELVPRILRFAQDARWGKRRPAPLRPLPAPATA